MKYVFLISISLVVSACAKNRDYIVCKPYLYISEQGSEIRLWDITHNQDAGSNIPSGNTCNEVIPQEFSPVEIGS